MRAVLRVAVGNDIPPVKGFARVEGWEREGDGAIGRGRLFVKMIALEFKEFQLELYKYIR